MTLFSKLLVSSTLCLGLILVSGSCPAAENRRGDRLVARVYQEEIYFSDLEPSANSKKSRREQLGEDLYAAWFEHYLRLRLQSAIIDDLVECFCREQQITVEDEEVAAYARHLLDISRTRLKNLRKRRQDITDKLADPELTGKQRDRLANRREWLDGIIGRLEEGLEKGSEDPGSELVGRLFKRSGIVRLVRRWKAEQALYNRYGGEVFYNVRGDIEPVGALQSLLEERLATFGVVILDPEYQDLFDDFQIPVSADAFEVSRRLAEDYYEEPWWLFEETSQPEESGAFPGSLGTE
jgi:hypothetical protein